MYEPPFCPNFLCNLHKKNIKEHNWYYLSGKYKTKIFGKVKRFRCKACGKYFSTQTFDIDYYAKRIIDYKELLKKIVSTSSIRDISRDFSISTGTVQNKIFRLSHQAMGLHEELKELIKKQDDFVADGFESYSVSQYFPNNIHLLALKESQYMYFSNYVTIRRKGRMTNNQKKRRNELEKRFWAPYKGVEYAFFEVLDEVIKYKRVFKESQIKLFTDEKLEKKRVFSKHEDIKRLKKQNQIVHKRVSSKKPRTNTNPLFCVNYLDRQMRKDLSNQVRETVCFSRNVNNCMEKHMVYVFYHNYIKVFREKQRNRNRKTHAEVAGIKKSLIDSAIEKLFRKRVFYTLQNLKGFTKRLWKRMLFTPLKRKVEYVPKYAFA